MTLAPENLFMYATGGLRPDELVNQPDKSEPAR
jgi:hypothetical protein